jgi:hypothetical protein
MKNALGGPEGGHYRETHCRDSSSIGDSWFTNPSFPGFSVSPRTARMNTLSALSGSDATLRQNAVRWAGCSYSSTFEM